MARYFLHLNPQDEEFGKVTTLVEIDDIDPNFILYHFADGTKCNKDYIGNLNDMNAFGNKEFVEVSDTHNIWEFEKKEIHRENTKPKYAINAQGQKVEVPSLMDYTDSKVQGGTKINVLSKPEFIAPSLLEEEEDNIQAVEYNEVPQVKAIEAPHTRVSTTSEYDNISKLHYLDVDYLLSKNVEIAFSYKGKDYKMPVTDFFENAIKSPEEKIIEKVVEKEVIKTISAEHIEIGIDEEKKRLVDNMIDMAQKEDCDIDMEITLSLPPVSVYQLIKSVYPEGMAKGFVNIIADRMQIKELKTAVAAGLLSYYNADEEIEVEETIVEDTVAELSTPSLKKKGGRPKKA